MSQDYTSLGLMSGTSGDGVDASIIRSDGKSNYEGILDEYYEYDKEIYKKIHNLKEKIHNQKDLTKYSNELKSLEKEITLRLFMRPNTPKVKKFHLGILFMQSSLIKIINMLLKDFMTQNRENNTSTKKVKMLRKPF